MILNKTSSKGNNMLRKDNKNIEYAGGGNTWSKLLFIWITPWMSKFFNGGITSDDLPRLPENDEVLYWTKRLERAVDEEERKSELKGRSLRLYVPLLKVFWLQSLLVLLSKLFYDVLQTLATLALRSFVASLEPREINLNGDIIVDNNKRNYFMGVAFILLTLIKILVEIHYSYWCGRVSLRIQGSLISMIFKRVVHWKASVISCEGNSLGKSARKSTILRHIESRKIQDNEAVASSNVFNLIVVDSLAVEGFLINGIECFVFPLRIMIAYLVLRDSLGSSTTIFGIATLIIFLILSFACQIVASSYKAPFMRARDRRIDRCHEVLSEIRTLQMMGLQDIANERVMKCRRVEMDANQKRTALSLIGNWIGYQMSGIAQLVLIILAIYKGIQNSRLNNVPLVISASVGVTTLKVLFSLLGPCRNLSIYSFATIEAIISFKRFQSFIRSRPVDLKHCDSHSVTSKSIGGRRNKKGFRVMDFEFGENNNNESFPNETDLLLFTNDAGSLNRGKTDEDAETEVGIDIKRIEETHRFFKDVDKHENIEESLCKDEQVITIDSKTIVLMRNSSYSWKSNNVGTGRNNRTRNNRPLGRVNDAGLSEPNSKNKQSVENVVNCIDVNSDVTNSDATAFKLRNINISLSIGETLIVVGSPGSGKTSLMNAILDEIVQESGITYVKPRETKAPIAYASQIPWIPSGSIRNTILFGREFNQIKYDKVLESCRLIQDFDTWQDGDLRIVDEGGCSLSGGQRARICLARALYSLPDVVFEHYNSDGKNDKEEPENGEINDKTQEIIMSVYNYSESSLLYLLDDIFVSLDPGVSKSIFKKLFGFNGLLRSVGTILSIDYNNLSFLMRSKQILRDFDPKILVLDEGSPLYYGTYRSYIGDSRRPLHQVSFAEALTGKTDSKDLGCVRDHEPGDCGDDDYYDDDDKDANNKGFVGSDLATGDHTTESMKNHPEKVLSITTSTKSETLRKVMEKEGRVTGMVSGKTYIWYFSKLKWSWTLSLFVLCFSKTMFDKGTDYYMGSYTSRGPVNDVSQSIYEGKKFALFYFLLSIIQLGVSSMVFIGEAICGIRAANDIHNNIFVDVLNAPLCFFDSNPVGRILSRFSTDLLMIDNVPIMKIATVLVGGMNVIFQCVVVLNAKPSIVFLFPVIGLGIYYSVARYFLRSSRELQRMCLVLYSPLCGVFSEAMSGGPIIRAYRAQYHYMSQGNEIIDLMQRAKYMQLCSKEWSSLRTQLLTFPLTILSSGFVTSILSNLFSNADLDVKSNNSSTGAGIVGIALYYSESIASNIGMVITSYVNMEKEMISAERLHKYDETLRIEKMNASSPRICRIVQDGDIRVNANSDGNYSVNKRLGIEIRGLQVRYRRPNSNPCDNVEDIYFPPAINGMSAVTGPNEHIGVIGRTGSGKSTFLHAILGLVPITKGDVLLDNRPINEMSPADKERLIGILPQVPLILKGWTVENFLDPYRRFTKDEIWNALNICGLSGMIKSLPHGKMLDSVIVPDSYREDGARRKNRSKNKCRSRGPRHDSDRSEAGWVRNDPGNGDKLRSDDFEFSARKSAAPSPSSSTSSLCPNLSDPEDERYLSDSQLRYLSLARLVLYAKDYRLILVDEPPPDVSHEDTVDYVPIHQLLRQYFPHCTVFVVAHHAASLKNCNKVWVLGKGRILLEENLDSGFSQDHISITFTWVIPYLDGNALYGNSEIPNLSCEHLDKLDREIYRDGAGDRVVEFAEQVHGMDGSSAGGRGPGGRKSVLLHLTLLNRRLIFEVLALKVFQILLSSLFSARLSEFMVLNGDVGSGLRNTAVKGAKLVGIYTLRLIFESQGRYRSGRLSLNIESLLMKLAFSRMMSDEKRDTREMNIINVIQGDCSSYPGFVTSLLDLITFPLKFALTWYLLKEYIGETATKPILVFVLVFSLGLVLQILGSCLKIPYMKYRDERIHKTHDFLRNITQIRLLGEEGICADEILRIRKKENYCNACRILFTQLGLYLDYHVNIASQLVFFVAYVSAGIESPERRGEGVLGFPLKKLGPTGVTVLNIFSTVSSIKGVAAQLVEGFVSVARFQSYMDRKAGSRGGLSPSEGGDDAARDHHVVLTRVCCKDVRDPTPARTPSTPEESPRDLFSGEGGFETLPLLLADSLPNARRAFRLEIGNGEKVFIIGDSGSGKTKLVNRLLSSAHTGGHAYHPRNCIPVGYVSQVPWLPTGTVRSVILFGLQYDGAVYNQTVGCCGLLADFSLWREGDLRVINEGGIGLSKGQKTRICLARALYPFLCSKNENRASIGGEAFANGRAPPVAESPQLFVFDDIFSNLDRVVGSDVFHSLFGKNGVLSDGDTTTIATVDINTLRDLVSYSRSLDLRRDGNEDRYSLHFRYYFISGDLGTKALGTGGGDCRLDGLTPSCNPFSDGGGVLSGPPVRGGVSPVAGPVSGETSAPTAPTTPTSTTTDSSPCLAAPPDSLTAAKDPEIPELGSTRASATSNIFRDRNTNINSIGESFSSKGSISARSYLWYLENVGRRNTMALIAVLLAKSATERAGELLFTGQVCASCELRSALTAYTVLSVSSLLLGAALFAHESIACTVGSNRIHGKLLDTVLLRVSSSIPTHMLLNRFGGDMYVIDTCIIKSIMSTILPVLTIAGQMAYIVVNTPYFVTPLLVLWFTLYIYPISRRFVSSYREYQRFLISAYSSIFSVVSCSQTGAPTIKMLKKEDLLVRQAFSSIEVYTKIKYIQLASTQWAGFWLNVGMTPVGILLNVVIYASKCFLRRSNGGQGTRNILMLNVLGGAELCIYYFPSIAEAISALMYKYVQMEKEMCSVERVLECINAAGRLELEDAASERFPSERACLSPPRDGLVIDDLVMSVPVFSRSGGGGDREESKYDVILTVEGRLSASAGEVIGVVGRTGSGKSSLLNSIMGLNTKKRGYIALDGAYLEDVHSKQGLKIETGADSNGSGLRSRINEVVGLLPQDCHVADGRTIKSVLDPFSEHSETRLLRVLEEHGLFGFVSGLYHGMNTEILVDRASASERDSQDAPVSESGRDERENHAVKVDFCSDFTHFGKQIRLSVSQVRYLSFLRLMVDPRKYRLLLLDEPPSNVVFQTGDEHIKTRNIASSVVPLSFSHCPVLIVSHNTDVLEQCTGFWVIKNNRVSRVMNTRFADCFACIWNEMAS
ncbi:ABC transporter with 9x transmembrande domains and 2xAAA [Cryptosporidium ryanae]|uniref:ABC transporter with 9x transmembrande domains and 2xAAA n=1 Tax=Cryptosporidium ryanae TaxID=515981 RepID=UPI003519E185|nr:ABC transporter with 9x transmembrande domains and 2xAAA [Cryptosporidium ryanae]